MTVYINDSSALHCQDKDLHFTTQTVVHKKDGLLFPNDLCRGGEGSPGQTKPLADTNVCLHMP